MTTIRRKYAYWGYLFILPAFAYYLVVFFYPLVSSAYSSFHDINLLAGRFTFVGLDKYRTVLANTDFHSSVWVTIRYVAMYVPTVLVISLLLAVLISKLPARIAGSVIVLLILPFISARVTAGMIWNWILDPFLGVVNSVTGSNIQWFRGIDSALFSVVIVGIWLRIGFNVIILLGSMRSISQEIFEASVIDGAGAVRQFFAITVPLINPTILLIITLDIINSFRVFGEIISTTEGGPGGATKSIMIYLVQDVFPFDYGRAAAISVMVIVVLLSVSIVQRLFRRSVQY